MNNVTRCAVISYLIVKFLSAKEIYPVTISKNIVKILAVKWMVGYIT